MPFPTMSSLLAATLAAVPVSASSDNNEDASLQSDASVASLPLYRETEEYDYYVNPPSKVEEMVSTARLQVCDFAKSVQPQVDRLHQIYETGVAHTNESLIYIRDPDHTFSRLGVMTAGGLLGLLAARKGSFLKRVTVLSFSLSGVGMICYPKETKGLASDGLSATKKGVQIAYNFAIGARPSVPNENGKAFEKMASMVSDVGQYGFRLFQREPAVKEGITEKQDNSIEPSKETTPEINNAESVAETEAPPSSPDTIESTNVSEPPSVQSEASSEAVEADKAQTGAESDEVAKAEEPMQSESGKDALNLVNEVIEGDPGQGYEEDKEMYTTRT